MPKKTEASKEIKEKEEIEEEIKENESVSDIELKPPTKKPYVLTEARKAQFEKARLIRKENLLKLKAEKEELNQLKDKLKDKKDKKVIKEKKQIMQKLE